VERIELKHLREVLRPTLPHDSTLPPGRASAVAAILRDGAAGCEVLLIKRADRAGDPWSGHMAFPGGRYEVEDGNLLVTAIRETREEVGIPLDRVASLIGVLEDQSATLRKNEPAPIRPFIFALEEPIETVTFNEEVAAVLWAPLLPLFHDLPRTSIAVDYEGNTFTMPGWDVEGKVVWGLTYRMLSRLFSALRGGAALRGR
jgi:8-oxo-dGTP pyrophosphatase MutT (NUDIX family)